MKHLIELSLKYIRRQRLRTFLTFMCITLSAFILTTICTYGSSLYTTLYNNTVKEDGSWEVDVSTWINKAEDPEKAVDMVKHHAVVDDYVLTSSELAMFPSTLSEENKTGYFEVSDGKQTYAYTELIASRIGGNSGLFGEFEYNMMTAMKLDPSADGVYLPEDFKDKGYSVGDTVTLKVRPVVGAIDESSDIVKEARAAMKEKYGTEYCKYDKEYENLTKEEKQEAYGGSITSFLKYRYHLEIKDTPLTDYEYGEPVDITMKVAGFIPASSKLFGSNTLMIMNSENLVVDLSEFFAKNPEVNYNSYDSQNGYIDMKIRLIDHCDYDEAMKLLFTDLGYDYDRYFNDYEYNTQENEMLLALELKSPYAIYKFLLLFVVCVIPVLLIGWFISRFVIDNSFEMAVQERSTHFAAMRIMGASKGQVAFVVLIEAIFYCITAVPIGMIAGVLICKVCFNSLINSGLEIFEFSAKPAFIALSAFLVVIAIFISAYTSAMWASRKLSPAEALNFGKPRSKRRKLRKRKSKLNISSKKFLRRYTRKNIWAAKSRFIVATITMALGVLMFTFTSLVSTWVYAEIKENYDEDEMRDFCIYNYMSSEPDILTEPNKYFGDKEIFSQYTINATGNLYLNTLDGSDKLVEDKLARHKKMNRQYIWIYALGEDEYKKCELDTITGMSYAEFEKRDGALYNNSIYDEYMHYDEDTGKPIECYSKDYTDLKKGYTISTDLGGYTINVIGKVSSSIMDNALIIPLSKIADLPVYAEIQLKVNGQEHYEEALKLVNEFKENCICDAVENYYMSCTGLSTFIKAIVKIVVSFLISIWLVGILSMINSVNTSVLNRSRELMMLRSVGMTKKQLRKSVMLETIMFSATAAILGTGVGSFAYYAFLHYAGEKKAAFFAAIHVVVLLSLGVNVIISLIAAIPAIRSLGRVESIAQSANG